MPRGEEEGDAVIAVVDYGMGNLGSVAKALRALGEEVRITSDPAEIAAAPGVMLPGVGAFGDAMAELKARGLVETLKAVAADGRPFLGICLGLQLLFSASEEGGYWQGLGILPGVVKKLRGRIKIPHIGWNSLTFPRPTPLFQGVGEGSYVYFVHSYKVVPEDEAVVAARVSYGEDFTAAICSGNIWGVQFHPEKSSRVGLTVLQNFAREVKACS
ncbi:MAG: imidazole glycerol-phosphate synthase subunit HisH [Bacillota bacterium]|nr:imidazole glycerol-phosphate synthase subunit HisH [Bacillota bacterium]MDK2855941.1 imidazole glycerol-phosphate synthase subunit HisH [Bacillota bacterium]MDK2925240.1 imidazole glycerol-phosphate synthase subunit HisH [Bacillota bacterium]